MLDMNFLIFPAECKVSTGLRQERKKDRQKERKKERQKDRKKLQKLQCERKVSNKNYT